MAARRGRERLLVGSEFVAKLLRTTQWQQKEMALVGDRAPPGGLVFVPLNLKLPLIL